MFTEYRSDDWQHYRMDYHRPHQPLEPLEQESKVVDEALNVLKNAGILPHTHYGREKFLLFRRAVAEQFEIPWTAITPRMQRLLYAINVISIYTRTAMDGAARASIWTFWNLRGTNCIRAVSFWRTTASTAPRC